MKIGIDCRVLNKEKQWAGVAQYTYHLAKNILALNSRSNARDEYVLFWEKEPMKEFAASAAGKIKHVFLATTPGVNRLPLFYSHWQAAIKMDKENLDLIHFPTGQVPLFLMTPYVATVHDLAIFRNPDWFVPQPFSRIVTPLLWRRAARLIAVSNFTKHELGQLMKIKAANISVIYEGVEQIDLAAIQSQSQTTGRDYFLFLGTIEPRKNIENILIAFDIAMRELPERPDLKLILAGKRGWKCEKIIKEIESRSYVDWRGYVSADEKGSLLREAKCLVYPSLYEGFGLPVLEAFACGTPVITSLSSSLMELAGDSAVLTDPSDPQKIAQSIKSILHDAQLVQSLKQKGRARAAQFTWSKTASETVSLYQEACKNCPRKL